MTTARQIHANRANARFSTGPMTKNGKSRVSRNALRHGMNVPVLAEFELSKQVENLAHKIAGPEPTDVTLDLARRVAEAQIEIHRIRKIRHELLARAEFETTPGNAAAVLSVQTHLLMRLGRYERRAFSRRKFAIRAFDLARVRAKL
jgi:hypothetical protein